MLLALDPDLTWLEALVRIGAAAAARAASIGLERELDEKAAGLRTHMLVAVGSALFTHGRRLRVHATSRADRSTRPGSPPRS